MLTAENLVGGDKYTPAGWPRVYSTFYPVIMRRLPSGSIMAAKRRYALETFKPFVGKIFVYGVIMKKSFFTLLLLLAFGLLSACDKSQEAASAPSAPEESTLAKMEKAYDKGYWEGFKKEFRSSFVQSCLSAFPSATKEAQEICDCAADKSVSVLKEEDIPKLEKDDPELLERLQ